MITTVLYCIVSSSIKYVSLLYPIIQNPSFYAKSYPYNFQVCTTNDIPFLSLTHAVTNNIRYSVNYKHHKQRY